MSELTEHGRKALERCIREHQNFIRLADDYDLDEMSVQALQTAIESMQMRLDDSKPVVDDAVALRRDLRKLADYWIGITRDQDIAHRDKPLLAMYDKALTKCATELRAKLATSSQETASERPAERDH